MMTTDAQRAPLERISQPRRRRVRFIQQLEAADCGAACLAMAVSYLGHEASLPEARAATGAGWRDGITALGIIEGALRFDVRGRAVSVDVDDLAYLPAGAILHWEFRHYVVFERVRNGGIDIVDPATGPRWVALDKVRAALTGVGITFERADAFRPRTLGRSRTGFLRSRLAGHGRSLSRVLSASLVLRLLGLLVPLITAFIVDRVLPYRDLDLLTTLALGAGALVVLETVTRVARSQLLLQLRTEIDTRLSVGFVSHLASLPFEFFQRHSGGDLVSRANSNSAVRDMLATSTLSGLLDGGLVLLYAGLILVTSAAMGAIVILSGCMYVVVYVLSRRKVRELFAEHIEAQAKSQSYLIEMIQGIETIKTCAAESTAVAKWTNLYVDELNVALRSARIDALVDGARGLITTAAPIALLVYGADQVMRGAISLGEMLALNTLAVGFWSPLSTLVENALRLQLLAGYADRINDVLDADVEQDRRSGLIAHRLSGEIVCDDVSFGYGPRAPAVVDGLSATFGEAQTIAIVGRSGCGKTTLAKLLCGLIQPARGRILWDGIDMRQLDLHALRRQIGVVTQQPTLFSGSLRSAIALHDPRATLLDVIAAAKVAEIDAEVRALPMGYNTIIADGGSSLSGGQRQRLAIARAVLHRPKILLLDEATSSLDADAETRVMANIAALRCTKIIIAHRLSTIANADLILVMDRGEIVERGNHAELIAARGAYHGLVVKQLGDRGAER